MDNVLKTIREYLDDYSLDMGNNKNVWGYSIDQKIVNSVNFLLGYIEGQRQVIEALKKELEQEK